MEDNIRQELVRKYQWAGKIRFFSFLLLFLFLLLMKIGAGYSYLNPVFSGLIFIEAMVNQPFNFLLKRVNIYRFQFYQMITDIIAISWVIYYMGGIEAPVVSIAYYAVILWAGVVSGTAAVFFAVGASAIFFTLVVILEHFAILAPVSRFNLKISDMAMFSLLLGNIAFMFAFGYFSAYSSKFVKSLEIKRQEERLKYTHKLLAAGYLLGEIAHDFLNHLISVRDYAKVLLDDLKKGEFENKEKKLDSAKMLERIQELETENIDLFSHLSHFARKQEEKRALTDLNKVIEDALGLTLPLARASDVAIEKSLERNLSLVLADENQMQGVFVTLFLNSLAAMPKKGRIKIASRYLKSSNIVEVAISDTGLGTKEDYMKRMGEPFYSDNETTQNESLGFAMLSEVISRHKGKISIENTASRGTTVVIKLPAA